MRVAVAIKLPEEERTTFKKWSRGRSTPSRLVKRAQMILPAAEGQRNNEIAKEVGPARGPVGVWRKWFADYYEGCAAEFPLIFAIPEPARTRFRSAACRSTSSSLGFGGDEPSSPSAPGILS